MLKVAGERKCREAQACLEGNIFILQDRGQAIILRQNTVQCVKYFCNSVVAVGDVGSCCAHKFIS